MILRKFIRLKGRRVAWPNEFLFKCLPLKHRRSEIPVLRISWWLLYRSTLITSYHEPQVEDSALPKSSSKALQKVNSLSWTICSNRKLKLWLCALYAIKLLLGARVVNVFVIIIHFLLANRRTYWESPWLQVLDLFFFFFFQETKGLCLQKVYGFRFLTYSSSSNKPLLRETQIDNN